MQLAKVLFEIVVTELGIVIFVSPVHLKNASSPIEVTEFGIVKLVKPVQL